MNKYLDVARVPHRDRAAVRVARTPREPPRHVLPALRCAVWSWMFFGGLLVLGFEFWELGFVCCVFCGVYFGFGASGFEFPVHGQDAWCRVFGFWFEFRLWNLMFGFRPHELHVERPDHAVPVGVPLDGQGRFTKPRGARGRGVPRKTLVRGEVEARQRLWGLRVRATRTPKP